MVYDSTLCYKNSERSQIQGIAKGFLDDIALATVEEQKLFKFYEDMELYLDNKT